jgi:DNA-binding transcriptional MerR regulator
VPPEDELLQRLARSSGLRVEEVRQLVELRVVAVGDGAVRPALLRRLRRVRRLRRDLGLSLDAIVIVVRLLDRIEVLEGVRARRRGVRVIDEPLP